MPALVIYKDETGHMAGFGERGRRAWLKFRKIISELEIGETMQFSWRMPPTMVAGRARMYTPAKTESYEGKAAYLAKQAMAGAEPITGPVALTIHAVFAHPAAWSKKRTAANLVKPEPVIKTPDWDNIGKIVSDSLNGICFKDDSQVARATVTKVYGEVPGVLVTVEDLS